MTYPAERTVKVVDTPSAPEPTTVRRMSAPNKKDPDELHRALLEGAYDAAVESHEALDLSLRHTLKLTPDSKHRKLLQELNEYVEWCEQQKELAP